jgi:hypothetical protein
MKYIVDMILYIYTKFHEDWFRYSGNIKIITPTTRVVVVFVLLMTRIS